MKIRFLIIIVALLACVLPSCEGYETDFVPIQMYINVVDSQGNSLLDPQSPNYVAQDAVMRYRGVDYPLQASIKKDYLAILDGFVLRDGMLYFGEVDGSDDIDRDFTILWADGSSDVFHIKHKVRTKSAKSKWTYHGDKIGTSPCLVYTIVK